MEKIQDQAAAARTQRLPAFALSVQESQLLTTLDFEIKKGSLGSFPATGPIPSRDITISTPRGDLSTFVVAKVIQPLSQLYRIGLGIRLQELAGEIAGEKLRSQRQAIVNEVRRAYYAILQTQSALESTREAIAFLLEVDRVVGEHLRQQAALPADRLETRTRLAREEHTALTLRNALAAQREQLNNLLGRDIRTEFSVSPVPPPTPSAVDPDTAKRRALERRPEMKEADLKVQEADHERRMKKSEYIPDVSLTFSYVSPFNVEVLPKNVATVGVELTWDVFDWGRKKRELAEKSKTLEQARNGVEAARALVLMDVNNRYRQLEESEVLLGVTELAVETAREKLRVAMDRHRREAALLKEVLQAQAGLAEANHRHLQAILAVWTARADFQRAVGEEG